MCLAWFSFHLTDLKLCASCTWTSVSFFRLWTFSTITSSYSFIPLSFILFLLETCVLLCLMFLHVLHFLIYVFNEFCLFFAAPLDDILQTASTGCGKVEEGSGNEIIITWIFFLLVQMSSALVSCPSVTPFCISCSMSHLNSFPWINHPLECQTRLISHSNCLCILIFGS